VVTHPLWVQEGQVQSPAQARVFMFDFFVLLMFCFYFFCKKTTHYLSQKFAIPFTFLTFLVYIRYCKIYDRL